MFKTILKCAFEKDTFGRALKVAFFVGLILNIINQGEAILSLNTSGINFTKMILTFFVPFMVSEFTAISMRLKMKTRGESGAVCDDNAEKTA